MPRKPPEPAPPDDPRRAATRARIVEAATRMFSRYGLRRTSVDELAAEASVAKPTLYAYFPDKDAIFHAVCEHVLGGIVVRAREAAQVEGSLEERLTRILAAKFTYLFELVDASPHAAELLGSSDRLAAELVDETDRRFAQVVRDEVAAAAKAGALDPARAGLSVSGLVDLLLRSGHGASYHARSAEQHRKNLAEAVRTVVAAVSSPARRR